MVRSFVASPCFQLNFTSRRRLLASTARHCRFLSSVYTVHVPM